MARNTNPLQSENRQKRESKPSYLEAGPLLIQHFLLRQDFFGRFCGILLIQTLWEVEHK